MEFKLLTPIRAKVCGITRLADALLAADCGADAVGFVFYEKSPRFITPAAAAAIIQQLHPFVSAVGLFVNASQQTIDETLACCPLDLLQLHGDESPEFCAQQSRRVIKALPIASAADLARVGQYHCPVLLDAKAPAGVYGGTGRSFDWTIVANLLHPPGLILAGGLHAGNLAAAFALRRWQAVDVSSGLEASPGIKCQSRMGEFFAELAQLRYRESRCRQ